MSGRIRWTNPAQPQTLSIAVFLLYINPVFTVLSMLIATTFPPLLVAIAASQVLAGYGIANERKWGYWLGVAVALLPFLLRYLFFGNPFEGSGSVLNLMFEIALIALLLHPQSRSYQQNWFK